MSNIRRLSGRHVAVVFLATIVTTLGMQTSAFAVVITKHLDVGPVSCDFTYDTDTNVGTYFAVTPAPIDPSGVTLTRLDNVTPGPVITASNTVSFTFSKTAPGPSALEVTTVDTAGYLAQCDPIFTEVTVPLGGRGTQALTSVPQTDHWVTIKNTSPDTADVSVRTNGQDVRGATLAAGEERTFDVSSSMRSGDNSMDITVSGAAGTTAFVTVTDVGPAAATGGTVVPRGGVLVGLALALAAWVAVGRRRTSRAGDHVSTGVMGRHDEMAR